MNVIYLSYLEIQSLKPIAQKMLNIASSLEFEFNEKISSFKHTKKLSSEFNIYLNIMYGDNELCLYGKTTINDKKVLLTLPIAKINPVYCNDKIDFSRVILLERTFIGYNNNWIKFHEEFFYTIEQNKYFKELNEIKDLIIKNPTEASIIKKLNDFTKNAEYQAEYFGTKWISYIN